MSLFGKMAQLLKILSMTAVVFLVAVVSAELLNGVLRAPAASNAGLAGQQPLVLPQRSHLAPSPTAVTATPVFTTPVSAAAPTSGPRPTPDVISMRSATAASPTPDPRRSATLPPAGSPTPVPAPPRVPAPLPGALLASATAPYSCTLPIVGPEPFSMKFDVPLAPSANGVYPPGAVKVTVQFSGDVTDMLNVVNTRNFNGTLSVKVTINSGDGPVTINMKVTLPDTIVPSYGSFTVNGTATLPSMSFTNAGPVSYTIGAASMSLNAYQPDGTAVPLDISGSCALTGSSAVPWAAYQAVNA